MTDHLIVGATDASKRGFALPARYRVDPQTLPSLGQCDAS